MLRFSQRTGIKPSTKLAQLRSIDATLRASLWNVLTIHCWRQFVGRDEYTYESGEMAGSNLELLIIAVWNDFFKEPIDTIPQYWTHCLKHLRARFFSFDWFEVYDFIEFISNQRNSSANKLFREACNLVLETENSAYRFVNSSIVEITSEEEIDEVESAYVNAQLYKGVATHLSASLTLMSQKVSPDYRNSIKESISAVESLAKHLGKDPNASLGNILKKLEITKKLHPSLKNAFSHLYGYTSDSDGIRHALMDETNLTKADARFMLICCSAFINYAVDTLDEK